MANIKDKFSSQETIAAIATFPAKAGIGAIKVSGNRALQIAFKIFSPKKKKDIRRAKTYTMHYGFIKDGRESIDEVVLGIMRKPYSYTREDVIEIYSHSGAAVLTRILDLTLNKGARLAEPGEFTKRAFLSGRIDLVQAEAVLDIVEARAEGALKMSVFQVKGELSKLVEEISGEIEKIEEEIESEVSFPEEGVEFDVKKVLREIKGVEGKIKHLLNDSGKARFLREGIKCVICGRANVGKSSLLNMLLRKERAIVTPFAGTTRDVVEEDINILGLPLKIYDTAGILESKDLTSEKAMEKSYERLEDADLVISVFDYSRKFSKEDKFVLEKVKDKNAVLVVNKIDLPKKLDLDLLKKHRFPLVEMSVLKSLGLEKLEKTIYKQVWGDPLDNKKESALVSNIRQINLLKDASVELESAEGYLSKRGFLDSALFLIKSAGEKIKEITGKNLSRDVLDNIFSRFCIGK